jgi:dimeric dUTPase (all-alpha-NTP-PPase superfamily)
MQKILQMLQLQQQLNDNTNGKEWEKGITKNGKIIDWKRCAYLECAELIESYPWKHWKSIDASPDYENIKIETVDIWHFIMSLALQEYYLGNLGDINQLAQDITNTPNYDAFCQDIKPTDKNYYEQIECVEELIKDLFCQSTTTKIIESFFEVAMQSSLNLDTLYKLYIGKNILNQFRQDNGYKQGTYIKIWNNKEDNVIMQEILDSQDDISADELYKRLQEVYQSL